MRSMSNSRELTRSEKTMASATGSPSGIPPTERDAYGVARTTGTSEGVNNLYLSDCFDYAFSRLKMNCLRPPVLRAFLTRWRIGIAGQVPSHFLYGQPYIYISCGTAYSCRLCGKAHRKAAHQWIKSRGHQSSLVRSSAAVAKSLGFHRKCSVRESISASQPSPRWRVQLRIQG